MRNPLIAQAYARKVCDLNFNKKASEMAMKIQPLDASNLFIHQVIKEWAPNLQQKMSRMKQALTNSDEPVHELYLMKLQLLEKTFLFEGYHEFFSSLIPEGPFPNVLTHNDAH